jgi:hypothetical protein
MTYSRHLACDTKLSQTSFFLLVFRHHHNSPNCSSLHTILPTLILYPGTPAPPLVMPRESASNEPLLGHGHGSGSQQEPSSSSGGFSLTVDDLAPLTDPTNPTPPSQLGGIEEICKALNVDTKVGLRSDEAAGPSLGGADQSKFEARSRHFGRNVSSVLHESLLIS